VDIDERAKEEMIIAEKIVNEGMHPETKNESPFGG
jgi:hypothetical protein